jgi:hypothetical protein
MEQFDTIEKINERMIRNQQRRQYTVELYKGFLDNMITGKKKGIRYRRYLYSYLHRGARVTFGDDGAEYDYIGKFGRGAWDEEQIQKAFCKAEQDIIVAIAKAYGGMDY